MPCRRRPWRRVAAPRRCDRRPARSGRGGCRTSCCSAPTSCARCASTATRSVYVCPTTPARSSPSCTARTASDHHMLAFAKSDGPGLHHSSWDVAQHRRSRPRHAADGRPAATRRLGRGSPRDRLELLSTTCAIPGAASPSTRTTSTSFPPIVEWKASDYPLEDSFYVWGPPAPDYFIVEPRERSTAAPDTLDEKGRLAGQHPQPKEESIMNVAHVRYGACRLRDRFALTLRRPVAARRRRGRRSASAARWP